MNPEIVVDALVFLDGTNPGFFSYMKHEEALRIQQCGLANAGQVWLKETDERKVPDNLKDGLAEITDVLVRLQPSCAVYLN